MSGERSLALQREQLDYANGQLLAAIRAMRRKVASFDEYVTVASVLPVLDAVLAEHDRIMSINWAAAPVPVSPTSTTDGER